MAQFEAGLDDDLNTAQALGAVFVLIREINNALNEGKLQVENRKLILQWLAVVDERLAIIPPDSESDQGAWIKTSEIEALIAQRIEARKTRDFAESDRIRAKLNDLGVLVEDTREGMKWRRK
jgi:cysteinyl-tRNA synthetase